jgi:hypothetical protein
MASVVMRLHRSAAHAGVESASGPVSGQICSDATPRASPKIGIKGREYQRADATLLPTNKHLMYYLQKSDNWIVARSSSAVADSRENSAGKLLAQIEQQK